MDKILFLFPTEYNGVSLSDFYCHSTYVDVGNVAHTETLVKQEDLYKEHIAYILPVDSKLTTFAGDIILRITLSKRGQAKQKKYVLRTGESELSIIPCRIILNICDEEPKLLNSKLLNFNKVSIKQPPIVAVFLIRRRNQYADEI